MCVSMPCGFSIKKIIALVNALAKLHNFCINKQDGIPDSILAIDQEHLMHNGGGNIKMVSNDTHNVPVPDGIMDCGHHFQDVPCAHWRVLNNNNTDEELPQKNAPQGS
jgi:hypothetical protein